MAKSGQPSVALAWETRFHRTPPNGESPTNDWIFYISRPTLESLRRADKEGKLAFRTIKRAVEGFIQEQPNARAYENEYIVETKLYDQISGPRDTTIPYITFAYPFDISDEVRGSMSRSKLGVYVHYGKISESDKDTSNDASIRLEGVKGASMFDVQFLNRLAGQLKHKAPPRVENADPMWMEFSSGKILPTDVLRKVDEDDWRIFQQLICSQFIEIRLIQHNRDMSNKAIREQVDALTTFSQFESGYSNFAGAPGTGKSTLLHMSCAHQLFLEQLGGADKKRILYYVASSYLKNEAKREIERILQYVYFYDKLPNKNEMVSAEVRKIVNESIVFCAQEDLFQINKPSYETNIITGSDKIIAELLGIKDGGDERYKKEINTFKRQLRQVIFGLFGEEKHFKTWVRQNEKKLRYAWMNHPLSLVNPMNARSSEHSVCMERFISFDEEYDKFSKNLRKLGDQIFDGTPRKDALWDPSSVVIHSSQAYSDNSIWKKHKGKIDQIIIDEIQDIALSEVHTLLRHFANRQSENPISNFRFVGAGDENQSIKFLEYFPNNEHMKYLFKDWTTSIRVQISKPSGVSLSYALSSTQQETLVSSYRIPNVMVDYVRDLLEDLRTSANKDLQVKKGRVAEYKKAPFGRDGVLIIDDQSLHKQLKSTDADHLDEWKDRLLGQLEEQLLSDDIDKSKAPKLALIYDETDWKTDKKYEFAGHGLQDYLQDKSNQSKFAERLNDLLLKAVNKIREDLKSKKIEENMSTEIKTALVSKGVISVKAIQGLTVPLAIVLPPSNIRPVTEHLTDLRNNMPNMSKFLVQITRAQYLNLILGDTRVWGEKAQPIHTQIKHENVTDWLANILENSMGLTIPYSDLFERTLREYQAHSGWIELESRTTEIVEDLNLNAYFNSMKLFHEGLIDLQLLKAGQDLWKELEQESANFAKIEETFGLQERFTTSVLPALKIFVHCNHMLREGEQDDSTIEASLFVNLFKNWIDENSGDDSKDTRDWFSLLVPEKLKSLLVPEKLNDTTIEGDNKNRIFEAISLLFQHVDKTSLSAIGLEKWPKQQLPQLNLSGWRLSKKFEEEGGGEEAWMEPDTALYTLPPACISSVLERNSGHPDLDAEVHTHSLKLWFYLAMTLENSKMFTEVFISAVNKGEPWAFPWYVALHKQFAASKVHFFKDFQESLENSIINAQDSRPEMKIRLSNFLADSETILQLQERLMAFSFNRWDKTTEFLALFERIVNITYESIDDLATNPFKPGEPVHKYIHDHRQSLRGDFHKQMFKSLYATEEAIRTGNFNSHIADNELEIPFKSWQSVDFQKAYFACLNKWTAVSDDGIKQLESNLMQLIFPHTQKNAKADLQLQAWVKYIVSLRKQERVASNNEDFKIEHNLIRKLQANGFMRVVQRFLGYAFNPNGEYHVNFSKSDLKKYLSSPASQLVYLLRTNAIEPPEGQELVGMWKNILNSKELYIGNPDVYDKSALGGEQTEQVSKQNYNTFYELFRSAQHGLKQEEIGILRLKWLPRSINVAAKFDSEFRKVWNDKGKTGRYVWPEPYCSNASFAALACLAENEIEQSIKHFEEAGLLNHAFALAVHQAYDKDRDTRADLLYQFKNMIRRDCYAADKIMYFGYWDRDKNTYRRAIDESDYEIAREYHFGMTRKFVTSNNLTVLIDAMAVDNDGRTLLDQPRGLRLYLPSSEPGMNSTPNERLAFTHWLYLLFFEHRECVKNRKTLCNSLEEMYEKISNNNDYITELHAFRENNWKTNAWSFRNRDHEAMYASAGEKRPDAINSYQFEYGSDILLPRAPIGSRGFIPITENRVVGLPGSDDLLDLIMVALDSRHPGEDPRVFLSKLELLTGVGGATLAHILPEREGTTLSAQEQHKLLLEEQHDKEARIQLQLHLQNILSDEKLPAERKFLSEHLDMKINGGASMEEIIEIIQGMGTALLKREHTVNELIHFVQLMEEGTSMGNLGQPDGHSIGDDDNEDA
jgi:hypothetical protein